MAKSKKDEEAAWWKANFPSASARDAADTAVDKLDVTLPMTTFLDEWFAAYVKAGGKTKHKPH